MIVGLGVAAHLVLNNLGTETYFLVILMRGGLGLAAQLVLDNLGNETYFLN